MPGLVAKSFETACKLRQAIVISTAIVQEAVEPARRCVASTPADDAAEPAMKLRQRQWRASVIQQFSEVAVVGTVSGHVQQDPVSRGEPC